MYIINDMKLKFIFSLLFPCVMGIIALSSCELSSRDKSGISYNECTGVLANPGRGWHYPFEVPLPKNDDSVPPWHLNAIANNNERYKIFQLRVNLVRFSAAGADAYLANHETQQMKINGLEGTIDAELSQAALDYLEQYFIAARTHKVGLIVRFGYLWPWYEINLHIPVEPVDFNLILRHIDQLTGLINQYPDVILSIESGMLGHWGEQHSTQLALGWCGTCDRCVSQNYYNCRNRNAEEQRVRQNFFRVIEKWLDSTRDYVPDVTISVRYPPIFVWWYNVRYGTNYSADTIHEMPVSQPGTDEYRIGVWNDSYLANETDSGTYSARDVQYYANLRTESLAWLERQGRHTYFGGEYGWTDFDAHYHTVSYMENEARLTHTTYLRGPVWMGGLLEYWRDNTYSGSDRVYRRKTTELQYIENRLGYRFVMRNSKLSSAPKAGGNLILSGVIENVGFAPMLFSASASVLLVNDETSTVFPVELNLNSDELDIAIPREYSITINLPATLSGSYDVYLKFTSDKNGEPIALANIDMYDSVLQANKIGFVTVDGD